MRKDVLFIPSILFDNDHHLTFYLNQNFDSSINLILVIIHTGSHWLLGAISLTNKIVTVFDSLNYNRNISNFRRLFFVLTILDKLTNVKINEFGYEVLKRTLQQTNSQTNSKNSPTP